MKMRRVVLGAWCVVLGAVCVVLGAGCGTQDPFGRESTPEEDAVVIGGYTQTVNQASQDTTIRPTIEVNGNNNVIIVGDRNDPALMPAPVEEEEAEEGV